MKMLPVDPNHRQNHRDDGHTDFAQLKCLGLVRDKGGAEMLIEGPVYKRSPLERDRLYQAYCEMMVEGPAEPVVDEWLRQRAEELKLSPKRVIDIINEGNGQYPGANMQWWRGVSLP